MLQGHGSGKTEAEGMDGQDRQPSWELLLTHRGQPPAPGTTTQECYPKTPSFERLPQSFWVLWFFMKNNRE